MSEQPHSIWTPRPIWATPLIVLAAFLGLSMLTIARGYMLKLAGPPHPPACVMPLDRPTAQ